jgi:hypothetical protein
MVKDSTSLVDEPRWHFGAGADGSPRSYDQWAADCRNANGDDIWPYEGDGVVRDGMDPGTVETFWRVDDYVERYGVRLDRVGEPRGAYLFVVNGQCPAAFAERSINPSAVRLPYRRYRVTGRAMPSGWRMEIGRVVSAHGARGGGRQVLFRDSGNRLVSVEELTGLGLLEEVRERV